MPQMILHQGGDVGKRRGIPSLPDIHLHEKTQAENPVRVGVETVEAPFMLDEKENDQGAGHGRGETAQAEGRVQFPPFQVPPRGREIASEHRILRLKVSLFIVQYRCQVERNFGLILDPDVDFHSSSGGDRSEISFHYLFDMNIFKDVSKNNLNADSIMIMLTLPVYDAD
jgi:hypothetical protein